MLWPARHRPSTEYRRSGTFWALVAAPVVAGAMFFTAALHAEPYESPREEIAALLRQLDDEAYSTRQRAEQRLRELSRTEELGPILAEQFRRVLLQDSTSYEVRSRLLDLRRLLPDADVATPAGIAEGEIEQQLDRLNADSFAARAGAREHLDWLLVNSDLAARIMTATKVRLASADVPEESRKSLLKLWRDVRGRWLLSQREWNLPLVEEKQWRRWVEDLCRPGDEPSDRRRRATARRELRDLLARKEYETPVKQALQKQLEYTSDSPATKRIERLLAWLRPAMVAEVWLDRQHVTIQHLYIGVPQMPEFAVRPTHFDRIDDQTAHCVSGSNLMPGDYPVGAAIPHPRGQNMLFHLINLPTPRRRMAYRYQASRPQAERLRELSQRTLAAVVADKRRLTAGEFAMLRQFDAGAVSRFVGPYFQFTKDQPLDSAEPDAGGAASEHGGLCLLMAEIGTHEAIPALEKAATSGELNTTLPEASHAQIAWTAALAIAQRDSWDQADDWLAGLVDRDTPLVAGSEPAADLGATAAAILLKRHDQSPQAFGLADVPDDFSRSVGVAPQRFTTPQRRVAVRDWWTKEKARTAEPKAS